MSSRRGCRWAARPVVSCVCSHGRDVALVDAPCFDRQVKLVWRKRVLASFPTCPIPEIKRLGKTLQQWRDPFPTYFDTGHANNGGTEAINGLIELQPRVALGFRNREHYRLRMLLIGGGPTSPPPQVGRAGKLRAGPATRRGWFRQSRW